MIKLNKIDHVCLWVRSLTETKSYYEKLFGMTCTPREGDETTLVVESDNIHFFISETPEPSEFISKQHISFEVESLGVVIDTLDEMGIAGYEVGEVTFFAHNNYKWCEWRDPNGIRIECVELV